MAPAEADLVSIGAAASKATPPQSPIGAIEGGVHVGGAAFANGSGAATSMETPPSGAELVDVHAWPAACWVSIAPPLGVTVGAAMMRGGVHERAAAFGMGIGDMWSSRGDSKCVCLADMTGAPWRDGD